MKYKFEAEETFFTGMCELLLAAVERIGFVGSLAFIFAPQWVEPQNDGTTINRFADCSDLIFGDSDFFCYVRRLPVRTRRSVFEALMKGPFCVAPFVGVLVKVIIPMIAPSISRCCDKSLRYRGCFFMAPVRCLFRLLSLIFAYDGGSVSCFRYVLEGPDTFSKASPEDKDSASLNGALWQVMRKPYDAEDEVMELEMSFLWVVFFAPILPIGVIITMVAKFVEEKSDLVKMLYVRRRAVPVTDRILRREMNTYTMCVAVASVGWSAGLSLITYNDQLYKWGNYRYLIVGLVLLWLIGAASAMSKVYNRRL